MSETRQDPAAIVTYRDRWTNQLEEASAAAGVTITVTDGTVTVDKGAVVVAKTVQSQAILFRLAVSGVTPVPTSVTVKTTVSLSNGDTDVHYNTVRVAIDD